MVHTFVHTFVHTCQVKLQLSKDGAAAKPKQALLNVLIPHDLAPVARGLAASLVGAKLVPGAGPQRL